MASYHPYYLKISHLYNKNVNWVRKNKKIVRPWDLQLAHNFVWPKTNLKINIYNIHNEIPLKKYLKLILKSVLCPVIKSIYPGS